LRNIFINMESTVGDRIKQIAQAKGLTVSAFSHYCNISPSAISAIIARKSRPSYDMMSKIAAALPDVSMDWLLLGVGEMMRDKHSVLVREPVPAPEPELSQPSDSACWEMLKREEVQHELLKKDYAELKAALRRATAELFYLKHAANAASHTGDWSNTPSA
jgi:transcriptional regulator with XRE-family HTH domain